ncbi:MAG: UDP-N-acetylmuramate--L-alanine ligase [Chloroflexota bacterium]
MPPKPRLIPGQHIHIIGIGGTGLSAIARVLLLRGFQITGSDLHTNAKTDKLQELGATIYRGHDAAQVMGAEIIIRSSAIKDDHVEVLSAKAQRIPVYKRFDIMSAIMDGSTPIAIAGTHGKTTTSSMTTHVLLETGQSPSYIVGGVLANTGHNADVGNGEAFVIEADEYDNMFHGLRPQVEVITSVEYDHPDFFRTPNQMVESFSHFVGLLADEGLLIACADDPTATIFARNRLIVHLPTTTYGIALPADWNATNIRYENDMTLYDVIVDEKNLGTVRLPVPGKHNILNSLAALIVADHQGVSFRDAADALATFKGAGRRFDILAEVNEVVIVDDYAHHPSAVRATVDAARQRYPEHDLWVIWQPHTFTRTRTLWEDYLRSFGDADHVIVTDIFPSREKAEDFPDVTADKFVAELFHERKFHISEFEDAVTILHHNVTSPAVVLTLSAGDAPIISKKYLHHLQAQTS